MFYGGIPEAVCRWVVGDGKDDSKKSCVISRLLQQSDEASYTIPLKDNWESCMLTLAPCSGSIFPPGHLDFSSAFA